MTETVITVAHPHAKVESEILVNKKSVTVSGHSVTGLQVLEAAIAFGLPVQLSFQVAVQHEGSRRIIGRDEVVHIKAGLAFYATAPDDNS